MALSRHEGDLHITGNLSAKTVQLPAGTVDNADIEAAAGIDASKLEHRHQITAAQPKTTAADETRVIHVVYGATGTVLAFRAGSIVANIGDSTVTVDLKKNGSSILTAPITLDSGDSAYAKVAGTIDTPGLVAGDVLEVVIDATVGTGTLATGVFCELVLNEDAE